MIEAHAAQSMSTGTSSSRGLQQRGEVDRLVGAHVVDVDQTERARVQDRARAVGDQPGVS
ncbi:hypothetical protein [Nonomuraea dietziae]|uniref:hypothetical protein n=1 Tax=Nonomuraea dietziae TaxID=65515 RepID=UPI0031DDCB8E